MPSLGTVFGQTVPHASYRLAQGDFIAPGIRLAGAEVPAEVALAPPSLPSPVVELEEACALSGLRPRTLRNLLHARDPLLLAARLPGKGYRFHRERFLKWVESRPDYARLPGVKEARREKANRQA